MPPAAGIRSGTPPVPGTAPTYAIQPTQADATNGLAEVIAGYNNGPNAGTKVPLPFGARNVGLPGAIAQTLPCTQLGGTAGSVTFDIPTAALLAGGNLAGFTIAYTFTGCVIEGSTINGNVSVKWLTYAPPNYSFEMTYSNLTASYAGQSVLPVSGKLLCSVSDAKETCNYQDNTGRSWSQGASYNAGVLNGTYSTNYGGGVITLKYTNFGATGGTAEIMGANGSKMVITRNSATKYTVVVTVNGQTTTYVFGA